MRRVRVHVLDANPLRRAQLARALNEAGAHAEIYESEDELCARALISGFITADHDTFGTDTGQGDVIRLMEKTGLPVSIYSDEPALARVVRAMLDGAFDYMSWPISKAKLVDLLRNSEHLEQTLTQELKARTEALELLAYLSPREREVLSLAAEGHSNKSTARVLDLSPRTVEIHRSKAFKKINARSVADAIRICLQGGLSQQQR